jgi:hypothetical protein
MLLAPHYVLVVVPLLLWAVAVVARWRRLHRMHAAAAAAALTNGSAPERSAPISHCGCFLLPFSHFLCDFFHYVFVGWLSHVLFDLPIHRARDVQLQVFRLHIIHSTPAKKLQAERQKEGQEPEKQTGFKASLDIALQLRQGCFTLCMNAPMHALQALRSRCLPA